VSFTANALINAAAGKEVEELKDGAAIKLAAFFTGKSEESLRKSNELAKGEHENGNTVKYPLEGDNYVVASRFLIDAALGEFKSLGVKVGGRVLTVTNKGPTGGGSPHTPSVLTPPRNAANLIGGPLEHATQVSGRFSLLGPKGATLYRADNRGNITSYAVYDSQGMIIKRVDVTGAAHAGVPTPHVIEYGRNTLPDGSVRVQSPSTKAPPRSVNPEEIP